MPPARAAGPGVAQASAAGKAPAKVYFSRHIDAEHLIELYKRVSADITGRVAIKLHTASATARTSCRATW